MDRLEMLIAKDEIREQLYNYCRSVDRIDPELGYSIFTEDSYVDYTDMTFQGTGRGFIDWCMNSHRGAVATSHQMTNMIIHVNDEKAGSETYCTAAVFMPCGDEIIRNVMRVRYNDKWERRDGKWLITNRIVSYDAGFGATNEIDYPILNMERENREDPSYDALENWN